MFSLLSSVVHTVNLEMENGSSSRLQEDKINGNSKLSFKTSVSVAYERLSFNDLTGENYSVLTGGSVWEVVSHESFFQLCCRFRLLKGAINLTSTVVELFKAFSDATTLRNYILHMVP